MAKNLDNYKGDADLDEDMPRLNMPRGVDGIEDGENLDSVVRYTRKEICYAVAAVLMAVGVAGAMIGDCAGMWRDFVKNNKVRKSDDNSRPEPRQVRALPMKVDSHSDGLQSSAPKNPIVPAPRAANVPKRRKLPKSKARSISTSRKVSGKKVKRRGVSVGGGLPQSRRTLDEIAVCNELLESVRTINGIENAAGEDVSKLHPDAKKEVCAMEKDLKLIGTLKRCREDDARQTLKLLAAELKCKD